MPILDSQVHAYERNHSRRPWIGTLYGPPEVTGDQMVAAMGAVGVDGAILVSPFSMYRYDASYTLEVLAAHPSRFRLVKPIDPTDPAVVDTIADWASTDGTVGIRIFLRDNAVSDPADPAINRVLATAAQHSLPVNVACTGRLDQARQLAARKWRCVAEPIKLRMVARPLLEKLPNTVRTSQPGQLDKRAGPNNIQDRRNLKTRTCARKSMRRQI
jgi:L-fuconolactonase